MKMRIILIYILSAFTISLFAQGATNCTKLQFTYDAAGNRVQRKQVNITCLTGNEEENTEFALKVLKPLYNGKSSSKIDIKAYPNPNNGRFDVVVESLSENTVLDLYDMTGRKVHSQSLKSENNQIDVTPLNTGTYILICRDSNNSIGKLKVVIE
jgi:Secretion system C-terminal sorting domain